MRRTIGLLLFAIATVGAGSALAQTSIPQSPNGTLTTGNPTFVWQRGPSEDGLALMVWGPSGQVLNSYQKQWWLYYVCPGNVCTLTPGLSLGPGTYTWAVVTYFNDGTERCSAGMTFTVVGPPAPTLIGPSGNVTTVHPTFQWNQSANATHYYVTYLDSLGRMMFESNRLDAGVACSGGVCSHGPGYSFTAGRYAFVVRAVNAVGQTPSAAMVFTTVPPAAPTPLAPSGAQTTTQPSFQWTASAGTTGYYVRFLDSAGLMMFESNLLNPATACTGNICAYTPGYSFTAGRYAFVVRAVNAVGESPNSAAMVFTTVPPGAPVPLAPSGVQTTIHPSFQWRESPGATGYYVAFLDSAGVRMFDSNLLNPATACSGGVCAYTPGYGFLIGNWGFAVRAVSPVGESESAGLGFSVVGLPPPTPLEPSGSTTDRPNFVWRQALGGTPADGAERYVVSVTNAAGETVFTWAFIPGEVCGTDGVCTAVPGHQFAGGAYNWSVLTRAAQGDGPSSASKGFVAASWLASQQCPGTQAGGDFNGDGRTDLLCGSAGSMSVALSNGTGFDTPQGWLAAEWYDPIVGDYNGDGKADVALYHDASNSWLVALSNGTSFELPTVWGTSSVQWTDGNTYTCRIAPHRGTGNFDGNGLTDVWCRFGNAEKVFVGKSTGHSFDFSIFGEYRCSSGSEALGAADVDGDGLDDFYCVNGGGGVFAALTDGTSILPNSFTGTGQEYCAPEDTIVSDINGDGRADIHCRGNGYLALSTGVSFLDQGGQGDWCRYVNNTPQCVKDGPLSPPECQNNPPGVQNRGNITSLDLDGDHLGEFVCTHTGTLPYNDVTYRKWMGTSLGPELPWGGEWCAESVTGGDIDGDGQADLKCKDGSWLRMAVKGGNADVMIEARSGIGGTTRIEYTPSTHFVHDNNPSVQQLVTAIETDDGRGNRSRTTYSYAGGRVDRVGEGGFLGYRTIRTTLPCVAGETACPYVESTYSQTVPSVGRPLLTERGDGAGTVLTRTAYNWNNTTTIPKKSVLERVETTDYGPEGGTKTTASTSQYDAWGNTTQQVSLGEASVGGDEVQTDLTYTPPDLGTFVLGRLTSRTKREPGGPALSYEEYDYQPTGQPWHQTTHVLPSGGTLTRTLTYTPSGSISQIVDERGGTMTTAYDALGEFPTSITNAANDTSTSTWHPLCGKPLAVTDANPQVTTTTYDALCRSVSTAGPLGSFTRQFLLDTGNPSLQRIRAEAPSSAGGDDWVERWYDGLGRVYRTVKKGPSASESIVSERAWNARGAVTMQTAPFYDGDEPDMTFYAYDSFDRLRQTTLPNGTVAAGIAYGLWSETHEDANGRTTTTQRGARSSRRIETVKGTEVVTETRYDALGRRRQVSHTGGSGSIFWRWTYDSIGRVLVEEDPEAGTKTITYSDAERKAEMTDAKSQTKSAWYDAAGRLTRRVTGVGETTFHYGESRSGCFNKGALTTVVSPQSRVETCRDERGQVKQVTRWVDGIAYTVHYTNDTAGRTKTTQYPDGDVVGPVGYDEAGRIMSIPGILSNVTYNAAGQPLVQTNTNATATTRSYWPQRGLLRTIDTTSSLAGLVQTLNYGYDAMGLVTGVTSSTSPSWSYGYDDAYRLVTAQNETTPAESQTWDYDEYGRMRLNSRIGTYEYPSPGQIRPHAPTSIAGQSISYDANGNLVSDGTLSPLWNAENRISAIGATGFQYDESGERIKKQTGSSVSITPFGDDYEVTNGVVTKYVKVDTLGVMAKRVTGGTRPGTYWVHVDGQGSMTAQTDATGAVVWRKEYRPYGEELSETTDYTESRGWIDQRTDDETGLAYLHARYYNPKTGLFLSPDPIGIEGGLNEYAYGLNSPANGTDRSGLEVTPGGPADACKVEATFTVTGKDNVRVKETVCVSVVADSICLSCPYYWTLYNAWMHLLYPMTPWEQYLLNQGGAAGGGAAPTVPAEQPKEKPPEKLDCTGGDRNKPACKELNAKENALERIWKQEDCRALVTGLPGAEVGTEVAAAFLTEAFTYTDQNFGGNQNAAHFNSESNRIEINTKASVQFGDTEGEVKWEYVTEYKQGRANIKKEQHPFSKENLAAFQVLHEMAHALNKDFADDARRRDDASPFDADYRSGANNSAVYEKCMKGN